MQQEAFSLSVMLLKSEHFLAQKEKTYHLDVRALANEFSFQRTNLIFLFIYCVLETEHLGLQVLQAIFFFWNADNEKLHHVTWEYWTTSNVKTQIHDTFQKLN